MGDTATMLTDEELSEGLSGSLDREAAWARVELANGEDTAEEELSRLADDDDVSVRLAVAMNPSPLQRCWCDSRRTANRKSGSD